MKLKDLKNVLHGKVTLYEENVGFNDLYTGEFQQIPQELLKRKICVMYASNAHTGELMIQLVRKEKTA